MVFLNCATFFIPMILTSIFSSVTNTEISSCAKIAGSMDVKAHDQLKTLNQRADALNKEFWRLFEKAKQNFFETGYKLDTFNKPPNFGADFTSSASFERRRRVTPASSYPFKNETGKPPDLILKCPFCQVKNRWTRESFVGGRIKCVSCSRQWEVNELGEEVT